MEEQCKSTDKQENVPSTDSKRNQDKCQDESQKNQMIKVHEEVTSKHEQVVITEINKEPTLSTKQEEFTAPAEKNEASPSIEDEASVLAQDHSLEGNEVSRNR